MKYNLSGHRAFATRYVFLSIIVLLSFYHLSAQEKIVRVLDVYKNAYETALEDGEIDENEEALLDAIRNALGLSEEDIIGIRTTVLVDSGHIDQSGRWLLVAQNMIYGASIYGWMIPDVLGADDTKWYVGSEMLSLAGSFYCTYQLTKNSPVSLSRAQMMRLGSLVGLRYGFGINTLLDLDRDESKVWQLLVMTSIPAGIYLGDQLYKHWQPSHGQSWTLGLGAGITAFSFHQIHSMFSAAPEEPSPDDVYMNPWEWEQSNVYRSWENDKKRWDRTSTLIEMAGYPIGIYLAHTYWANKHISFGDGLMLTQGTFSGASYAMLLAVLLGVDIDNGETWRLFPILGSTAGTLLMDRYIHGYDYTPGQAFVSTLGTLSGTAFMAGIAVITETRNEKALSAMLMSGGIAGLLLTNRIFDLKKEKKVSLSFKNYHINLMPGFHYQEQGGHKIPTLFISARF